MYWHIFVHSWHPQLIIFLALIWVAMCEEHTTIPAIVIKSPAHWKRQAFTFSYFFALRSVARKQVSFKRAWKGMGRQPSMRQCYACCLSPDERAFAWQQTIVTKSSSLNNQNVFQTTKKKKKNIKKGKEGLLVEMRPKLSPQQARESFLKLK